MSLGIGNFGDGVGFVKDANHEELLASEKHPGNRVKLLRVDSHLNIWLPEVPSLRVV
jgi:hypothetical protein